MLERLTDLLAIHRLPSLDERKRVWDEATAKDRLADPKTTRLIQRALESQLTRSREALKNLDDKASLVIPGVGIVGGVVGTNVHRATLSDGFALALFGGVLVSAVLAVLFSLYALAPDYVLANGPDPERFVVATGELPIAERVRLVNDLGFAVKTTQDAVNEKALWLNFSMRAAGIGVGMLLVFIAVGGMQ